MKEKIRKIYESKPFKIIRVILNILVWGFSLFTIISLIISGCMSKYDDREEYTPVEASNLDVLPPQPKGVWSYHDITYMASNLEVLSPLNLTKLKNRHPQMFNSPQVNANVVKNYTSDTYGQGLNICNYAYLDVTNGNIDVATGQGDWVRAYRLTCTSVNNYTGVGNLVVYHSYRLDFMGIRNNSYYDIDTFYFNYCPDYRLDSDNDIIYDFGSFGVDGSYISTSSMYVRAYIFFTANSDEQYNDWGIDAYADGYSVGYDTAYEGGYSNGYNRGYNDGLAYMQEANQSVSNIFTLLRRAFDSLATILNIQVLPNINLGMFIFIPLAVTIIVVVIKMIKG